MRIVQFEIPGKGRRTGVIDGHEVCDLTSLRPHWKRTVDIFHDAEKSGLSLKQLLGDPTQRPDIQRLDYESLLTSQPEEDAPFLHPPVDAADSQRLTITGTGLTHLGSMQSRDSMHAVSAQVEDAQEQAEMTDSAKMFSMGVAGGKPPAGERGRRAGMVL